MRSDVRTLCCLAVIATTVACDANAVVLVRRGNGDGDASMNVSDGGDASVDASSDGRVDGSADASELPDGGTVAAVQIYGTGFADFAGLTVYGRLGPFSSTISSATIAADGTFVMPFPPVTLTVLNNIYFDLYVDVDGNGDCSRAIDEAGGHNVTLEELDADTYRGDISYDELLAPIPFTCNGL